MPRKEAGGGIGHSDIGLLQPVGDDGSVFEELIEGLGGVAILGVAAALEGAAKGDGGHGEAAA